MSAYQALKEFTNESERTQEEIEYDNYYFKCCGKMLNQQDYEMSSIEESVLHGLHLLYETKLDGVLGKIFKEARSVEFQKEFYTKLFIYDKIRQIEKECDVTSKISDTIYSMDGPKTITNIDGEQVTKSAIDMFHDFASEELKEDKEFLSTINTFCNKQIKMTFSSKNEEKQTTDSTKKESKIRVLAKKFTKNI